MATFVTSAQALPDQRFALDSSRFEDKMDRFGASNPCSGSKCGSFKPGLRLLNLYDLEMESVMLKTRFDEVMSLATCLTRAAFLAALGL